MPRQVTNRLNILRALRPRPTRHCYEAWQLWHVWIVTIPRRSITGQLVWGTVLRRRDDDRWIYKKYVDDLDLN